MVRAPRSRMNAAWRWRPVCRIERRIVRMKSIGPGNGIRSWTNPRHRSAIASSRATKQEVAGRERMHASCRPLRCTRCMERDERIGDIEERIQFHADLHAQRSLDDSRICEPFSDQNFSTRTSIAFVDQRHELLETDVGEKAFSAKKFAQARCLRKVCLDVRHQTAAQMNVVSCTRARREPTFGEFEGARRAFSMKHPEQIPERRR